MRPTSALCVALVALGVACSRSPDAPAPEAAPASDCAAYIAARAACFQKLGPAASETDERAFQVARSRLEGARDEAVSARCRAAATQIAAACR